MMRKSYSCFADGMLPWVDKLGNSKDVSLNCISDVSYYSTGRKSYLEFTVQFENVEPEDVYMFA